MTMIETLNSREAVTGLVEFAKRGYDRDDFIAALVELDEQEWNQLREDAEHAIEVTKAILEHASQARDLREFATSVFL